MNLAKPLGVKFKRGNDGAAYVSITDPRLGNTDPRIKPGDRVVAVSASFGGDVWEARNFGQVIYAIKTRNGEVFLRLESRGGNLDVFEVGGCVVEMGTGDSRVPMGVQRQEGGVACR